MAAPEMQVKVSADTSELEAGLRAAQKATAAFVAGVGALAAGIGAAVKSVVNMADEMTKASQKTGIAVKELQELAHAAGLSGLSAQELQGGIARLTKGMADFAAGGSSEAARALKAVGVEIKNSDGSMRSSSDVLGDLAEKFSGYRDGAEKSALALSIFGRAGLNMIPMLNSGRAAIEDARKEMQDFGAIASDQLGKDSERLNDNLSRMGTFFTGIATQIAERVVPALANATDEIVRWMRESNIAQSVGNALGAMFENLEEIVIVAGTAMAVAFGPALLASIVAIGKAIIVGLLGALAAVASLAMANPITAIFVAGAAAAAAMGVDVIGIIKKVINGLIGAFEWASVYVNFILSNLGNVVGSTMIAVVNKVIVAINEMVKAVKKGVNLIIIGLNATKLVKFDPFDVSEDTIKPIVDKYGEALGPALAERNRKLGEINGKDYIGSFIESIKGLAPEVQKTFNNMFKPPAPTVGTGGGEGGGKSDEDENKKLREKLERRLEVVRQSVLNEEQLMVHKYQKAQELAAQAFALDMEIYAQNEEVRLQKVQEYQALREALEQKHLQNLDKLRADSNARSLNNLASFFSGAQSLAQSNGNKSFKAAKGFAIAQAILSTTAAAIQAMADPTAITPFQKFANYAAVLGKGLSAVASIRSMQPSGGGGGGGGGGAGAASGGGAGGTGGEAAGRAPGGNSVYINLQGQSFGRDQVRDLVKQIADFQKDGGQVVFA